MAALDQLRRFAVVAGQRQFGGAPFSVRAPKFGQNRRLLQDRRHVDCLAACGTMNCHTYTSSIFPALFE
jgi:hypothetical protein